MNDSKSGDIYCRVASIHHKDGDKRYIKYDTNIIIKNNDNNIHRLLCPYNNNPILEDMKLKYYHSRCNQTFEEVIVGFVNVGISNPHFLYEVVCDSKYIGYTVTKKTCYEQMVPYLLEIQKKYEKRLAELTTRVKTIYMLDNKLFTLDELDIMINDGEITKKIAIDWNMGIKKRHHIGDFCVNVLCDELIVLMKRISENRQINKILHMVKSGQDEILVDKTILNIFDI